MKIKTVIICVVTFINFYSVRVCAADTNWPDFRGPAADGVSQVAGTPKAWSETENVKWKTAIHDHGHSTPVVWGDQIWLTTATKKGHKLYAVCIDRNTGRMIHDILLFEVDKPGRDRFTAGAFEGRFPLRR